MFVLYLSSSANDSLTSGVTFAHIICNMYQVNVISHTCDILIDARHLLFFFKCKPFESNSQLVHI